AAGSSLLVAAARPELHVLTMAVLVGGLVLMHDQVDSLGWEADLIIGVAVLAVAVRGALAYRRMHERTVSHLAEAMTAARAISHVVDLATLDVLEVAGDVA